MTKTKEPRTEAPMLHEVLPVLPEAVNTEQVKLTIGNKTLQHQLKQQGFEVLAIEADIAADKLVQISQKLAADKTKTQASKVMLFEKEASKILKKVLDDLAEKIKIIDAFQTKCADRVDNWIGNTEVGIQILNGRWVDAFEPGQRSAVMSTARSQPGCARAIMADPIAKRKFSLDKDEALMDSLMDSCRKHCLGSDYEPFMQGAGKMEALQNFGIPIYKLAKDLEAEVSQIRKKIYQESSDTIQ